VTGFEVEHPSGAPSFAVRLEYHGKIIADSGDTQWTDALTRAADGADLFAVEAYFFGLYQSAPYQGVTEMLGRLRDGARLFAVRSKVTANAERILQVLALRSYFDIMIESSPEDMLSDKADALETILEEGNIDANSTAMVGDYAHEVLAGKRNGVFTIGVTYGYGTTLELKRSGADQICDSPAGVTEFVRGK